MTKLLDTNACISLINGKSELVRRRFEEASRTGEEIVVSSLVVFELWYGVAKSAQQQRNLERLTIFLSGPLELREFDDEDARFAGQLRAELERRGNPIGAYDVLIAGQALRYQVTLVTANVSEFSRVPRLQWEDWEAKP